jgi:potassium-transporting ATPase potassium-binding subunit
MSSPDISQLLIYLIALTALSVPLGLFMANVYEGKSTFFTRPLEPVEKLTYRLCGINSSDEMNWKVYALSMLLFNTMGLLALYGLQRLQPFLPLNPQTLAAVSPDSSLNTAISFASNTNWQGYSGEATLSYFSQMLGLTVQNFVSAATGMAVLAAFIRAFARQSTSMIGNFWVDLVRTVYYILLPLSIVISIALVSQGTVQTLNPASAYTPLEAIKDSKGADLAQPLIALGPAASQVAIKQLGTNGGGFFNVNSSHPLENPTPLSNFIEVLSILIIPAALCWTFGKMVGQMRQGAVIYVSMFAIFLTGLLICALCELSGNPLFREIPNLAWKAKKCVSAFSIRRSGQPLLPSPPMGR